MTYHSIQILDGITCIRKRPSMFIGEVSSRGFQQLIEHICEELKNPVTTSIDGTTVITASAHELSFEHHQLLNKPKAEILFTNLGAGKYWGSFFPVLNALSQQLTVEAIYSGRTYKMNFTKGKLISLDSIEGAHGPALKLSITPDAEIIPIKNENTC